MVNIYGLYLILVSCETILSINNHQSPSGGIGMGDEGTIVVPDLIGKSLAEAEKVLADSSLKVGKINR